MQDELISKQAVLDLAKKGVLVSNGNYKSVCKAINELPSVNPQEPKSGKWINAKVGKMFPSNDFKCSECGNILDFNGVNCGRGDANYCPNCGAEMIGDTE